VVTSGSALSVVKHLHQQGEKILWAPDKHLGNYVNNETKADMLLWQGACVVHERFKADALIALQKKHPEAATLVHPESPQAVVELATVVGSTTALINAVKNREEQTFIVATDNGIFHKMHEVAPHKKLIEAPTMGEGADCESCAHCEWMAMNTLEKLLETLNNPQNEIKIDKNQGFVNYHSKRRVIFNYTTTCFGSDNNFLDEFSKNFASFSVLSTFSMFAPTMGEGADCESCAHCEWMAMNTLEKLLETLNNTQNEIEVDKNIAQEAQHSIQKLLDFTEK
jgi:quinolinate synthase